VENRIVEGLPGGKARADEPPVKRDGPCPLDGERQDQDPDQEPNHTRGRVQPDPSGKEHALPQADPLPHQQGKGRRRRHHPEPPELYQQQEGCLGSRSQVLPRVDDREPRHADRGSRREKGVNEP
jgi:hypothetical protein